MPTERNDTHKALILRLRGQSHVFTRTDIEVMETGNLYVFGFIRSRFKITSTNVPSITIMNDIRSTGHKALVWIQDFGLLIIVISTVIATGFEITSMIASKVVTLADLLLLFIYLEVIAMAAMYLESGKLPVRMPLYIAIVALARYLILDMKNLDTWRMLGISGAALLIAIAVLVIRFGHVRFPYKETDNN